MLNAYTKSLIVSLVAPLAFAQQATAPLSDEVAERIVAEGIENSGVQAILREMTGDIGHRLTGSENFTKACAWAKERGCEKSFVSSAAP